MNEAQKWKKIIALTPGEVPGAMKVWRAGVGEKSKMLTLTVSQNGN